MYNNGLILECLKVCRSIENSISPFDKWAIVNIGFSSEHEKFNYPTFPSIKEIYGFTFDGVIEFLEKSNVIIATDNNWFIGLEKEKKKFFGVPLFHINQKAHELEFYQEPISAQGYFLPAKDPKLIVNTFGPINRLHVAALVDMAKLKKFIWWYSTTNPRVYKDQKLFSFMNQSLKFEGEQELGFLILLTENLNSIVSHQTVYELRNPGKWDIAIKSRKITPSTANKDLIKRVKDKLKTNKVINSSIYIIQNDGVGMFIDQNKTLEISKNEFS